MNEKILEFLVEAKKGTYANSNSNSSTISSRLGSKDYEYKSGNMIYHDTYFGSTNFIGEEVIYDNSSTPIWGMNYYGTTVDEQLTEEAMDMALRPALMKVGEDSSVPPLRGPSKFINGNYTYQFKVDGTIDNFTGIEEIYKGNKLIFKLTCIGGLIK